VDSRPFSDKSVSVDYLDLIGVQFAYGGRGPDTYDCYGLVMELHRRCGVELPDFKSPTVLAEIESLLAANKYQWRQVASKPKDDLIPMSAFQPGRVLEIRMNMHACHVGFIHRPRRFLHVFETSNGVEVNEIHDWRERILGVYEYAGS
jgi:cell wall-associated NlpC family hydrolase